MTLSILLILFLGAFFDATLVTCFFVFGEAFFLMAGGFAYTDNDWRGVMAVLTGAYLADQTGFLIGRQMKPWFLRFARSGKRRRSALRKTRSLLRKHGVKAVAGSRLMGPVAWFMPPICGGAGMPWHRFAIGSLAGVGIGVGMFLVLGYISAWGADQTSFDVEGFIERYKWALLIGGQAFFILTALIARYAARFLFSRV